MRTKLLLIFLVITNLIYSQDPTIISYSPIIAGTGEQVVITGTNFTGITTVMFGNQNATSFSVDSPTQITAIVGAGASGDVAVSNGSAVATKPDFIYKIVDYKFEGDTLDATGADLDASLNGTATYSPGASGSSICFSNSYTNGATVANFLNMPSNLIRGRSNFTISLRFKTSTYGTILAYNNGNVGTNVTNYVPILYIREDGKLSANLWLGTSPLNVTTADRVDDGNWHKVEFSATPGSITIYVDDVPEGTSSGTIDHLDMSFNQLGAGLFVNSTAWPGLPTFNGIYTQWLGFNGCIDEFFIVDQALTESQIQLITALPEPTIGSFSPTSATGGNTVTIIGTNFSGATTVNIGGVSAQSFIVVSDTEITAVVANNASDNDMIEVITAGGTVSVSGFTFLPDFDLDGISDSVDLDDDNDGVLDTDECGEYVYDLTSFTLVAPFTEATNCPQGIWYTNTPLYKIGSPNDICFSVNGGGATITDHTTGSTTDGTIVGIQAGASADGITEDYVTAVTFTETVVQNSDYELSLAYMIWGREDGEAGLAGTIQVFVNDVFAKQYKGGAGLAFGAWEDDAFIINSATNTSLKIDIKIKRGINGGGNDYMLDDITFKPVNITCDTDNDGIINQFDLDSDNDGCSDAYEAGATSDTTTDFQFSGPVGANGLVDSLETTADSGTLNYSSTFSTYGLDDTLNLCTTLETVSFDKANLTYYPNPTTGILNITYSKEISEVTVLNVFGQVVLTKKGNNLEMHLDMSNLSSATYFVKIASEDRTKTIKVVKRD